MNNKEVMAAKSEKLNSVRSSLKTKFIGLDKEIDQIIDAITVWYVSPDLLRRPTVINMWGMTGVGKTSIVRAIVSELALNDRFSEIQNNRGKYIGGDRKITDILASLKENNLLGSPENGIVVLVDEFQNLQTRTMMGSKTTPLGDIWEVLSTGKITRRFSKLELMDYIYNLSGNNLSTEIAGDSPKSKKPSNGLLRNAYSAISLKNYLDLDMPVEAVMKMTIDELLKKAQMLLDKSANVEYTDDYSKTLFFISGNLDDAFPMSSDVSRVDVDPDVVHAMTRQVTIFDVKRVLSGLFFPEQVARLGNTHIIFPSLSKASFNSLITRELETIKATIKNEYGINISFTENVHNFIFRNGVFATQGTRPLFSSINNLIDVNLNEFLYNRVSEGEILIDYDDVNHYLFTAEKKIRVLGSIDVLEMEINSNKHGKTNTSLHEIGHALTYAILFNTVPPFVVSLLADRNVAAGYMKMHGIRRSPRYLLNCITVGLAGLAAEELAYGSDFRTDGSSADLRVSTSLAAAYVRRLSMHSDFTGVIGSETNEIQESEGTSKAMIKILKDCKDKATKILTDNRPLLVALTDYIYENNSINSLQFKEICENFNLHPEIVDITKTIIEDYRGMYEKWRDNEYNIIPNKEKAKIVSESTEFDNLFI